MTETNGSTGFAIAAFYRFQSVPAERLEALAEELETLGAASGLRGLLILATEGLNGTVSAPTPNMVNSYLARVSETLGFPQLPRKWSSSPNWPFKRFKVRLRDEIVTLGKPGIRPLPPQSPTHLSPEEWDRMLEQDDVLVIDTRNWYETRIGKFKKAIDPNIEEFSEFSGYLDRAAVPRDKKVLIYCTGGIRCEKAIVEMHNKGFQNVYQLDGGILNYLAQRPNQNFEGECFVFDHRVALDQALKPSANYRLCPHCGQPGETKLTCLRCDAEAVVCQSCYDQAQHFKTCSKNCAYHYQRAPGKKGRSPNQSYRYKDARETKHRLFGCKKQSGESR